MERVNCERYPCHFPEQDCAFCFCPFYPCRDSRTGGRDYGGVWACDACHLIHRQDVAAMVMDVLMKDEAVAAAWKKLETLL